MQGFVPHLYQKLLNNTVKIFSFIEFFMPAIEIFLRRNFLLHFQHFLFQPILALQEGKSNRKWGHSVARVQRVQKERFLRWTGLTAGGFLSLTALRAEGCGIALSGDEYEVSVTDLLLLSYGKVTILVISRCAAPPYPAAPDFPPSGGQNKALKSSPFISSSQHNGAL